MMTKSKFSETPSIFIPFGILRDSELKQGTKLCYGGLVYFAKYNIGCSPKRKELAELLNVSTTQIDIYLRDLENHCYIKVDRGIYKDKRNRYRFLLHRNFYCSPSVCKVSDEELKRRRMWSFFSPMKYLYGAYLPLCVLQDTNISQASKVCLARLVQFDWKNLKNIFVSKKLLAEECGASLTQIKYYLRDLEDAGYIEFNKSNGRTLCKINQEIFFGKIPSKPRESGKTKTANLRKQKEVSLCEN